MYFLRQNWRELLLFLAIGLAIVWSVTGTLDFGQVWDTVAANLDAAE